jgi:hypothetical protein
LVLLTLQTVEKHEEENFYDATAVSILEEPAAEISSVGNVEGLADVDGVAAEPVEAGKFTNTSDDEIDDDYSGQFGVVELKDNASVGSLDKPARLDVTSVEARHPPAEIFKEQVVGKNRKKIKTLRFQKSWYTSYPWLHYEPNVDGILCFFCASAGVLNVAKNVEPAFTSTGFKNWKRAIRAFQQHESSHAHKASVTQHIHEKKPVVAQLSEQFLKDQEKARNCLSVIFKCIRYIARQGLAMRGHESDEGNLKQLLNVVGESDEVLKAWFSRHQDYTSSAVQNEVLSILARNILQNICKDMHSAQPMMFSLM